MKKQKKKTKKELGKERKKERKGEKNDSHIEGEQWNSTPERRSVR